MSNLDLKTVKVSDETHAKILSCGKMGDSLDDVIGRVIDYYIREMRSKK